MTLKLTNQWGDRTLKDLKRLIYHLGFPTSHLHIIKVTEGCIAVHMLCPLPCDARIEECRFSSFRQTLLEWGTTSIDVGETVALSLMNTDEGEHSDYICVRKKLDSLYI